MPSASVRTENVTPASCVETNNFHEIIRHFDDSGELKNPRTSMKVECQICQCNDLAILCRHSGEPADDLGEGYTVLPGCGHGFGTHCLWEWIKTKLPYNAQCPSCRAPIDLENTLPTFYNRHNDPAKQRKHITKIRALLKHQGTQRQSRHGRKENSQRESSQRESSHRERSRRERPQRQRTPQNPLWGMSLNPDYPQPSRRARRHEEPAMRLRGAREGLADLSVVELLMLLF
ncbi:hypothetical protein RRF57_004651 [Xylaria bambusicola]|uniref:RING-type domain-containing protein n=1 Tax=Xylaria bambusicola TaxID=326684 RepID=A0AAN7UAM9_9PEZI